MLQSYSSPIVENNFRIKVFLDTNILSYLIDGSYPCISQCIQEFQTQSTFVDLITSKYVIFELLEVRKREEFRRIVTATGSPLSYYNNRIFNSPGVNYETLLPDLKHHVEEELNAIRSNHNIALDSELHDALLKPTFDTCLSSRLSREDSLVLTSSLNPKSSVFESNVCILTNDQNFNRFFNESTLLTGVLGNHSLEIPTLWYARKLKIHSGTELNLTDKKSKLADVPQFTIELIKTILIEKNPSLFVGFTNKKISSNNPQIIGFDYKGEAQILSTSYLVIIGKNLDFVITCPATIQEFRGKTTVVTQFPITNAVNQLVFKWPDIPNESSLKQHERLMLSAIKETGNLVFLYP